MKQKDIALIAVIIIFSTVISYVATSALFGGPKGKLSVSVVQPISPTFPDFDKRYFNKQSFDPTKLITIGQNNNTDPFGGTSSH